MHVRPLYSNLASGLFVLASAALLTCLLQANVGYPFRITIRLNASEFTPDIGYAFVARLPIRDVPAGNQAASSRFIEAGHASQLYTPKVTTVVRVGAGTFSFEDKKGLILSTTDNTDPRTNGRSYALNVPRRVSRALFTTCGLVWIAALFIFLLARVPLRNDGAPISQIRRSLQVVLAGLGKWRIALLLVPSVYMAAAYPPLWKDVDALAQLVVPAGALNILHFPPVYCFLARVPFLVVSWFPGGAHSGAVNSVFSEQHPSLLGVYLLILAQHLLLVLSLSYAIAAVTRNAVLRGLFALFAASCSAFYVQAHSCGSEGLSTAALVALFGSGISVIRNRGGVHWAVYAAALFFAIGSRHINVLFAVWLPLTLVILGLAKRIGSTHSGTVRNELVSFGLALLLGIVAVGANIGIARFLIAAVHDDYRSTLGRTLSDRVDRFLDHLSQTDRVRLAQAVSARTNDPHVQYAIGSQAVVGSYYNGTNLRIADELERSGVPLAKIGSESDRVILEATMLYLKTLHPMLLREIFNDFAAGLTIASDPKIAWSAFDANRAGAEDRIRRPDAWKSLEEMPSLTLPCAAAIADRARRDPYIDLPDNVPTGVFLILTTSLIVAGCVVRKQVTEMAIVATSILLAGILVYAANAVCIYYMDRYTLPLFVSIAVALLAAVSACE